MKTVCVPSGIGDVSWLYSKLKFAEPLQWEIADGWPYRTKPFLDLLPGIAGVEYGNFVYSDIILAESIFENGNGFWPHKWTDVGPGRTMIEVNRHLEAGRRLEDWLPDLPVDFHYPIRGSEAEALRAKNLLAGSEGPIWGVSAASYRGSEAWNTWGYAQWREFLKWFRDYAGGRIFLLGGFWDDLTSSLAEDGYPDLVGKTSIGCTVEILRRLDGYIGFSSGLGVIMTVLGRKTFMMWPLHQQPLSTSWAPPEMLEAGTYAAHPWGEVEAVKRAVKRWLEA